MPFKLKNSKWVAVNESKCSVKHLKHKGSKFHNLKKLIYIDLIENEWCSGKGKKTSLMSLKKYKWDNNPRP